MKRFIAVSFVIAVALASGSVAKASITVTAEPDAYANGANISTAFYRMTLSAIDAGRFNGVLDGNVYARLASNGLHASTGTMVFGNNMPNVDGDGNPLDETWYLYQQDAFRLRVDFHSLAKTVSIDIICNDDDFEGDYGVLEAYDSGDNLLATFTTGMLHPRGDSTLAVIDRPSYDIAYVIVSGVDGDTVCLDNLSAVILPPPASVLLGGLGVLLVGWLRRRRTF